jgi:hypothetical protein
LILELYREARVEAAHGISRKRRSARVESWIE